MNNLFRAKLMLGTFLIYFSHQSFANTQWFDAAREGNNRVIEEFIKKDKKIINLQDEKGYTAFILSSYNGHLESAKLLLNYKANPCLTDSKGNNALMGVIFKGYQELIDLTIPLCEINHTNKEGQTPLMYAALFGREDVVKSLIKRGADPKQKDNQGRTAITLAEGQFNKAMAYLLKTLRVIKN